MKVTAYLHTVRIATRKAALVSRLVKGMDVKDALIQLENTVKRTTPYLEKLIKSAVANAEHNFGLDRDNLYVADVVVGEGPRLKRWLPRAFGRATLILKRTSRLTVVLEERVEGKNRKTAEQLKKEKEERIRQKAEAVKAANAEKEISAKEDESESKIIKKGGEKSTEKQKAGGKWVKKIFQRKSV